MARGSTKTGYCPHCVQNVLHIRCDAAARFPFDTIVFPLAPFFRRRFWHCCQCQRRSRRLRRCRRDAPTNRIVTVDDFHERQPVGNFLRSERSLIMHQKRSARFSEKFRDGVVAKILTGTTSIRSVCQELEVLEPDVVFWIADVIRRKDQRIEELLCRLDSYDAVRDTDQVAICRGDAPSAVVSNGQHR